SMAAALQAWRGAEPGTRAGDSYAPAERSGAFLLVHCRATFGQLGRLSCHALQDTVCLCPTRAGGQWRWRALPAGAFTGREALALTEARPPLPAQRLSCPAAYGTAAGARSALGRVVPSLGQPAAAAALCLELAAALRDLGQPAAAAGHFQRAAQLQLPQLPLAALQALGEAASCQLLARDYTGALAVFTRMQRLAREHGSHPVQSLPPPPPPAPQPGPGATPALPAAPLPPNSGSAAPSPAALGAFSDVLVRCEVSRVLLLLLLQPPPAKLLPEHAQTLEKYSWEAFDSHGQESSGQLPEELFLLLQSLVMATHEKDTEAIKSLQVEMWPLLTAEQNHLLHLVLQETISPSGQGV
uniref:Factor VIII intron 22 protein n=1 Tax=Pan troglodytes TaxID=9598 RepID=A0A2I3SRC6_PANTR